MPILGLRYDLRCAPFDATTSADLVATALEQCEWADRLGFASRERSPSTTARPTATCPPRSCSAPRSPRARATCAS